MGRVGGVAALEVDAAADRVDGGDAAGPGAVGPASVVPLSAPPAVSASRSSPARDASSATDAKAPPLTELVLHNARRRVGDRGVTHRQVKRRDMLQNMGPDPDA